MVSEGLASFVAITANRLFAAGRLAAQSGAQVGVAGSLGRGAGEGKDPGNWLITPGDYDLPLLLEHGGQLSEPLAQLADGQVFHEGALLWATCHESVAQGILPTTPAPEPPLGKGHVYRPPARPALRAWVAEGIRLLPWGRAMARCSHPG